MQFTISRSELQRLLKTAGQCLNQNNIAAAFGSYRFQVTEEKLTVTCFDGERSLSVSANIDSDCKEIFFVQSNLFRVLADIPDQPLLFEIGKGQIICKHTGNCSFRIPFDVDGFVTVEHKGTDEGHLTIGAKEVAEAIGMTSFACADSNDIRLYLQGVLFEFMGTQLNVVATNGGMFSRQVLKCDMDAQRIVIPKRSADIMAGLDVEDAAVLSITNKSLMYSPNSNTTFITGLIADKYLSYDGLILNKYDTVVTVDRSELLLAVKRAATFAKTALSLNFSAGIISVSGKDEDWNKESSEVVKCDISGPEITIQLLAKNLIPVLSKMDCLSIDIHMNTPNRPIAITKFKAGSFDNCMVLGTYA